MKTKPILRRSGMILAIMSVFLSVPARSNPIADSPVFKLLTGEWEGSGELENEDGSKTPVKETWTGQFTETGNFVMSGKRTLDQNEHDFAWEFYANGDLIEGQMKMSEPEVDSRFEAQIDDTARSITLKVPLGSDGTLMTIVNTVAKDGKTIHGTVSLTDSSGKTTLKGTVDHSRKN